MSDQETADSEAKNEEEVSKENEEVLDEEAEESIDESEESPLKDELERLKKLDEEKTKEIEQRKKENEIKDRALQAEKKKRKELEEKEDKTLDEEKLLEKLDARIEARERLRDVKAYIKEQTDDPVAQEVYLRHYNSSIQQTGNLEEDVQNAIAIANKKRLTALIEQERQQDLDDERSLESMTGGARRNPKSSVKSPARKMAEQLIGDKEAIKKLDSYVR